MIAERAEAVPPVDPQGFAPFPQGEIVGIQSPNPEGYLNHPHEMLPGESYEDTFHDLDDGKYFFDKKKIFELFPGQVEVIQREPSVPSLYELSTFENLLPVRYAESEKRPGLPKIKNKRYELEFEQIDPQTGEALPQGYVFGDVTCSDRSDFFLNAMKHYDSRGLHVVDFYQKQPYAVNVLDSYLVEVGETENGDIEVILEQFWEGNHFGRAHLNKSGWRSNESIAHLQVKWFKDQQRMGVKILEPDARWAVIDEQTRLAREHDRIKFKGMDKMNDDLLGPTIISGTEVQESDLAIAAD